MQNRYVGDVGDFGKYALLRALVSDALALAVVWCAFPDENHNGDGRHVSYLDNARYRALDPELHDELVRIVKDGRRSMAEVEAAPIFRRNTMFVRKLSSGMSSGQTTTQRRSSYRREWVEAALADTVFANLVFFDPDNGIGTAATARNGPKGGKFIYWDELLRFWERGQSLVVYHHLNRTASVAAQTESLRVRFHSELGHVPFLAPLTFRRGSCRHFWIVGQEVHGRALRKGVRSFLDAGWHAHFELALSNEEAISNSPAGPVPTKPTGYPTERSTKAMNSRPAAPRRPSLTTGST